MVRAEIRGHIKRSVHKGSISNLNLVPVLGFLHHLTDLDQPDKPVMSVFLI